MQYVPVYNKTRMEANNNQLEHMQIICPSTRKTHQHLICFFQAGCSNWFPTNSIKAWKAIGCLFVSSLILALSFKDVDLAHYLP